MAKIDCRQHQSILVARCNSGCSNERGWCLQRTACREGRTVH